MTTVILTIVGILIAAAAALMVLWYGGESFDTGAVRAEAATSLGAVVQIADAVQLKETTDGTPYPAWDIQSLVGEKYMTSIPVIPGAYPYLMNETGCAGCSGPKAIGVVYAMADTKRVRAMCTQIERRVGNLKEGESYAPHPRTMLAAIAASPVGCSWDGANFFVYSSF